MQFDRNSSHEKPNCSPIDFMESAMLGAAGAWARKMSGFMGF
jgi:hypothetical protein